MIHQNSMNKRKILRPERILKHEDKVLRIGKVLRRYLVKFANYPDEDARWMQEPQLKESLLPLIQEYKAMSNLRDIQEYKVCFILYVFMFACIKFLVYTMSNMVSLATIVSPKHLWVCHLIRKDTL